MARDPIAPPSPQDAHDPWHEPPTALRDLTPASRAKLAEIASALVFVTGEVILRDATPTPFLGLVESGRIGLRLAVPERGNQTVVTIEPGELVGWSALVAPYRATAEAVALEPTTIEAFDAARLRALLATDRDLAAELMPVVLSCVSDRLTSSWQQLLDLFSTGAADPW
ncbi:MAG: cyclic nucleotide-binding domain-containing protein [Chloroflexi bacterium]|nr:cyclic nucleotide-binding domain-containing protein [Chloroflexota bacterium]